MTDLAPAGPAGPPARPGQPAPRPGRTEGAAEAPHPDQRIRKMLRLSSLVILIAFGGVGGWFAVARLDSAAVAPGVLTNEGNIKSIQHPEGGVVSEIAAHNGDRVEAGDLLLRLDQTQQAASSTLFRNQLLGATARRDRLRAEILLADEITWSDNVRAATEVNSEIARAVEDETRRFEIARSALDKTERLLRSRIDQARIEIEGYRNQKAIAAEELEVVNAELENLRSLRERGLADQSRVTDLTRERLSLRAQIATSETEIAAVTQSISGMELEIQQARDAYQQTAASEMETVTDELQSLQRDAIVADQSLDRVEIRAPVTGTVQESQVFTEGGVVNPGDTIMRIAPASRDFIITAEVSPGDIDAIVPGTEAEIQFPAFQNINMPPFDGELVTISRDRIVDDQEQRSYYEAQVRLFEASVPDTIKSRLVAGMGATVILPTGERTALQYLLAPVLRRLNVALREE